jgi:sugar transferase EpsL
MTQAFAKRLLDLVVAGLALMAMTPLLAVLALLIRLRLGSPVMFSQTRPGMHGTPFKLLKFRTMTSETDIGGHLLPDDKRMTSFGAFLRRTSLDELPEFLNVMKGEMSLVGPRPLLMEYLPLYSPRQARRHAAKPGITGWAQVNGRNAVRWEEKFELDVWYVDHQSFWLDLQILGRTFWCVLSGQGITQAGHATVERFRGSAR